MMDADSQANRYAIKSAEAKIIAHKELSLYPQVQNDNVKFEKKKRYLQNQIKIKKNAGKFRTSRSRSVRIPADYVITQKVIIAIMRKLHTDAIEEIAEAAIQELDARVGDCDLEPEYDCDVDNDHPIIHSTVYTRMLREPRAPAVALNIVGKCV